MTISHQRLDKFISKNTDFNRKSVKILVAQKRISIDGELAMDVDVIVHKFSQVFLDDKPLQANTPVYIMLHKPVGIISSTKGGNVNEQLRKENPNDLQEYQTVIDILEREDKHELHYAGRLDLNTSGLMLLTNDSRWSKKLSSPLFDVEKKYIVTLANKLTPDYVDAFAQGVYFRKEDIVTKPAKLKILSAYQAEVILTEGKNHQIKRMFGKFDNPVVALHRSSIGNLQLETSLNVGESRDLTELEVTNIYKPNL